MFYKSCIENTLKCKSFEEGKCFLVTSDEGDSEIESGDNYYQ